jgi:hypothetical protein
MGVPSDMHHKRDQQQRHASEQPRHEYEEIDRSPEDGCALASLGRTILRLSCHAFHPQNENGGNWLAPFSAALCDRQIISDQQAT